MWLLSNNLEIYDAFVYGYFILQTYYIFVKGVDGNFYKLRYSFGVASRSQQRRNKDFSPDANLIQRGRKSTVNELILRWFTSYSGVVNLV
jgi:hypothetical protein